MSSSSQAGTLYVVATPIGNLGDITLRAIDTLRAVSTIAAEDTRRARALLSHLGITGKRLACVDAHARAPALEKLADRVAHGEQIAVLTDAGTPAVSDPGSALVRLCRLRGLRVTALPGASAVTTAVAASGLVDNGFLFLGFLPRKGDKRRQAIERIARTREAVVLFEAPTRVQALLRDLATSVPERELCVARELTKKFEQVITRPAADWASEELVLKGEITLLVAPDKGASAEPAMSEEQLEQLLTELLEAGWSAKDAAAELARVSGRARREMYRRVLERRTATRPKKR